MNNKMLYHIVMAMGAGGAAAAVAAAIVWYIAR